MNQMIKCTLTYMLDIPSLYKSLPMISLSIPQYLHRSCLPNQELEDLPSQPTLCISTPSPQTITQVTDLLNHTQSNSIFRAPTTSIKKLYFSQNLTSRCLTETSNSDQGRIADAIFQSFCSHCLVTSCWGSIRISSLSPLEYLFQIGVYMMESNCQGYPG